jgi:hypothetical protein
MLMPSLFHTVAVRCVKIVPRKSREAKRDRQDPTLSDTIRILLLQKLAKNSYLEDREKKALRITTRNGLTSHGVSHYPNPEIETRA